ncbi:hypothetical protein VMCG_02946 [Cytospora schulzeri]|uniref:Uncharacterized protein n=1 Tax=Cytospora schulzeri TaxID=448051 RepID=A0A423WZF4_9PEZI|nr:hypothetical protein VMCG_02946 [Valsa malicola]
MATPTNGEEETDHGPVASPFFNKLPAELRLKIYREVFSGSHTLVLRRGVSSNLYLAPNSHNRLLLTCHQAYEEACSMYWSMTTVIVGGSQLPDFAGLEEVFGGALIEELQGVRGDQAVGMGLCEFLGHFERVSTVRLVESFSDPWNDLRPLPELALDAAGIPRGELVNAVDRLKVVILRRSTYRSDIDPDFGAVVKDLYINHATGKTFETEECSVNDDEGFQKVL